MRLKFLIITTFMLPVCINCVTADSNDDEINFNENEIILLTEEIIEARVQERSAIN